MSDVKRYRFKGAAGEYIYAGDFDDAMRSFLRAAELCLDSERREAALREELANHDSATKLINAWVDTHGKQIPWDKAIEIIAVVTKMPEAERQRLLCMDDQYELQAKRLTAAEQRNAELAGLLHESVVNYGYGVRMVDIHRRIDAALKPTESGASDAERKEDDEALQRRHDQERAEYFNDESGASE